MLAWFSLWRVVALGDRGFYLWRVVGSGTIVDAWTIPLSSTVCTEQSKVADQALEIMYFSISQNETTTVPLKKAKLDLHKVVKSSSPCQQGIR